MQNKTKLNLLIGCMFSLVAGSIYAAPEFTPDSQPTGWISRPVVTDQDLTKGTEAFYQLDFRKNTWSGNVLALDINSTARIQTTGPWDDADPTLVTAASLLDDMDYSADRKIVTYGSPFRWGNMTDSEQGALGSEDILNYVRGDRSNEEPADLSLRRRASALGDIQHSNIYYRANWASGVKVNETLYVGANDGMLHSFNAVTGEENFAYVPSMLIPKLDKLAAKPYVHTHFVDGPISIASMELSNSTKDILVGGLGAGGAGLYGLDVTTPTAASEAAAVDKILWEITPASDSFGDLGHTYGTPVFARIDGTPAVIVGNGYVNTGSGHAVLYIINAETGVLINAIDTGSGSADFPNGLSSATLYSTDGDPVPEYAYAGDIDGTMWKFDLVNNTSTALFTTDPAQAITTAPAVHAHPLGGVMVVFATGRILTSGDQAKTDVHYVYGIWDGAPNANSQLLVQTLVPSTYQAGSVRTMENESNTPNWAAGSGNHYGWKVALPPGERVVGEKPFYNNGRFYFLSHNPTLEPTENWLHELVFNTGGAPLGPIYDLNQDGLFNDSDLASNNKIPVAKYLGNGVFSQPRLVEADGLSTTLYAYHPDLEVVNGVPTPPDDPGVSGGHFDFDIYYFDPPPAKSTGVEQTRSNICAKEKDVDKELEELSTSYCTAANGFDEGYGFMTDFVEGSDCGDKLNYFEITCSTFTVDGEYGDYSKVKHVHEYDDKYDVTGVNMLNASLPVFNLSNAILDVNTKFKVLVMNQYLNPAALLSVGATVELPAEGEEIEDKDRVGYESVKTYANLADADTSAVDLLGNGGLGTGSLETYTRADIGTLIFNLPLDAFKVKDWWGDKIERAGLIPTQTGCVNNVNDDGSMKNEVKDEDGKSKGVLGPQGERFNGSLTIQLIKADTSSDQIELNGPDYRYGWRVKQEHFTDQVLVEYTVFWHHPNKACYGDDSWVKDPPEDFDSDDKREDRAPGSADPQDGIFAAGLAITGTEITVDGLVTTTTVTYSDGTEYVKTETKKDDGSTVIHSVFRDGETETITIYTGDGGRAGFIDPNTGSPEEELSTGIRGRQSWRETDD